MNVIKCYGIEFSYEEIKCLKETEGYKEYASEMTHPMTEFWTDMGCGSRPDLCFIYACDDYEKGEEYFNYMIGLEIEDDMEIDECSKLETREFLKEQCEKYNLKYREPKIICKKDSKIW